jgi:formate--tetrahydrofolate ligase
MNDIEISKKSIKQPITEVIKNIGLSEDDISVYGKYKAKIDIKDYKEDITNPKLILVTAMSPTPYGEGKTTVSIGLSDALCSLHRRCIVCLREPSMGPVFGFKGGATGGGLAQVVPMEDINLHFTGDLHAITSANNLISAAIDNHIYFGNKLDIKKVLFKRCVDVNDRALRRVKLDNREEEFTITAASEIMALFTLAKDLDDLRERLGRVVIGINSKDEFVYVRDLNLEGSLVALLKDAIKPNAVQTLENNPAFIHGGPFANIAHGCSSIISTKTAMKLADYVITEAGFGAELGAEKFFDIKCRVGELTPYKVVLVSTIKALKYHGGCTGSIYDEDFVALEKGFENLDKHYSNLKKFGVEVVVCLNQYATDSLEELKVFEKHCIEKGYTYTISNSYNLGGQGSIDLANKILEEKESNFNYLYELEESYESKINKVCKEIYGASSVKFSDEALSKLALIEKNEIANLPICVAKTQYSFSDDKNKIGVPKDFEVTVKDIQLYLGAGFVTVYLGNILTMPGLPEKPNYEIIDVEDGEIINLS